MNVFTVTGEVLIATIVPFCTVDLVSAGGGTVALGVTGNTGLFIAATTATAIDANYFWVDTAPDANGVAVPAGLKDVVVTDDVIMTIATGAVTAGAIRVDVYWLPLSSNGDVVAA